MLFGLEDLPGECKLFLFGERFVKALDLGIRNIVALRGLVNARNAVKEALF